LARSAARLAALPRTLVTGRELGLDPALEVGAADAAAARLDQQADGVRQPAGIAPDLRRRAAHRDAAIGRIGRDRVVPVAAEAGGPESGDERCAKPFLRRLGDEGRHVGGAGVLQQHVEALHRAEAARPERRVDRVLVQVEHDQRREAAHQLGLGLRFRRAQQQVVAVEVDAIGRGALAEGGAVGIGARQEIDVDLLEDALESALAELLCRDQQRLGAGRLVAVLAGDDDDRGATADRDGRAGGRGHGRRDIGPGEGQHLDRRAALRDADRQQLDRAAPARAAGQA
jgi:hypothetical protein